MLQINDEYRIRCDTMNIMLEKLSIVKSGDNEGSESWGIVAYFGKWQHVFKKLVDMGLMDSENMIELRHKYEELYSLIDGLDDKIMRRAIQ